MRILLGILGMIFFLSLMAIAVFLIIIVIKAICKKPVKPTARKLGIAFISLVLSSVVINLTSCKHEFETLEEIEATCVVDGYISKVCKICGQERKKTIPATGHSMGVTQRTEPSASTEGSVTSVCNVCGYEEVTVLEKLQTEIISKELSDSPADKTPTEDRNALAKENELATLIRQMADKKVFSLAEDFTGKMLKIANYSPVYSDEEILDSDEYLRYVVKLTVTVQSALQETYVCTLRLHPDDTSTYTVYYDSFAQYTSESAGVRPDDWGKEPDDFYRLDEIASAGKQVVSLKDLLIHREKYDGYYVIVDDSLVVADNDWRNSLLRTYFSAGGILKRGVEFDYSLLINYAYVEDVDSWATVPGSFDTKVNAEGFFHIKDDDTEYLEAIRLK